MSELLQTVQGIAGSIKTFTADTDARLNRFDQRLDQLTDRVEVHESLKGRPGANEDSYRESALDREHKTTFESWIRKPDDKMRANRLSECEHEVQKKDITIGNNAGGGYGLPKQINDAIEFRIRQLNPFRQLCDVQNASTNDYHSLVSMGDASSGWVSETGSRSATTAPTLRDRAPTFGEVYSYPTASEWSLDDIFFDVKQWLTNEVAADFASQEATAIVSGNGSAKPTGILNSTPVTTSDSASPMRAAGVIQYVSLQGFSPTSPVSVNFDAIINLVHQLAERYTMESDRCAFVMHRLTVAALRMKKASTSGTYLWNESMIDGQPPRLLGFPVYTCDAVPQASNDNFAILFGNWYRGYLLCDRTQIRITPNPYSVPGQVSFYVRRRVGGCIKNNDSLKALRIAD